MSLPAPNLDDRNFQSLVNEAKRMVQQRCPEWTDHNVSDPGVTLIETFAYMVDQLVWRLNKVPDRTYIKFLELIGLQLAPPSAARAPVTFWLSAPQAETLTVPTGTEVATPRGEEEPVVFQTTTDVAIIPSSLQTVATEAGDQVDRTDALLANQGFYAFAEVPEVGNCFYVGLSNPVPSCAVTLRLGCEIEGVGVDPRYPPLAWEAWDGDEWVACEVDTDETGGLNRDGDVILHVPATHRSHAAIVRTAAGWLRCRVVESAEWQPAYSASPRITRLAAFTIGGTADAVNAEIVADEIIGISEGVPGQRFSLQRRPVVPGDDPYVVEVSTMEGWEEWTLVDDFASSGAEDRHFMIDEAGGEIVFGPAVREADGGLAQYGMVPEKPWPIRVREYRAGGGRHGNVARHAISVLKSTIPYVARVSNRRAALGGTDGESIENAKRRGPLLLRTRERAVTPEDYEQLTMRAARDVARVRCVPAGTDDAEAGAIRILIVPRVSDGTYGALDFGQLVLPDETYQRVSEHLDARRTIGARIAIGPPSYVTISVVASLRAKPRYDPRRLETEALEALYGYFHPVRGGPDGEGWPFGRPVHAGEVYSVLQSMRGLEFVEEVRLYPADPLAAQRGQRQERIELGANDLIFSWDHQVMVQST
jgi:predicted phage baseplate assembly protein